MATYDKTDRFGNKYTLIKLTLVDNKGFLSYKGYATIGGQRYKLEVSNNPVSTDRTSGKDVVFIQCARAIRRGNSSRSGNYYRNNNRSV